MATLRAALPSPAQGWLDNLGTVTIGSVQVDLQYAALYAAASGQRPASIILPPAHLSPPY